jgi:DNA-binding Lrp family transcriptional regulator
MAEEPTEFVAGGRLDDRVIVALQELHGRIACRGLRRALGAHPEALSRSLRRLEREGLVERSEAGYRALTPEQPPDPALTGDLHPIARVELPMGTTRDSVLGRLSGRWFGSLRWVGVIDAPRGRLLAWARRDGSGYVLLGVRSGRLEVFVPGDSGPGETSEAEEAAYEVLGHALEALRPGASTSGAAYLAAETPAQGPWPAEN